MQFLKKNYEKIILGVVVLAALGLVASLPFLVSSESQKLADMEKTVIKPNLTPLQPLDMSKQDEFISRAHQSIAVNLDSPHKIFNPVRWQLKNGAPYRNPAGQEIEKLVVTKITPLNEIYSLQTISTSEGLPTHYGIGVTHQAAARVSDRNNPRTTYVAMNQTTNNFTVVAADGTDPDTATVTLELSDTGKRVTITKARPYERPEGYMADLVYQPDNKGFANRRKTDSSPICFANECYKIVDITEREVVLLQLSNQKTWIKEYNPTNSTSSAASP